MRYTCVLLENGSLRCFGLGIPGWCPVPTELGAVKEVAAGSFHTCALLEDGSVRCFGSNNYGQCSVPTGLGAIKQVAAGSPAQRFANVHLFVTSHMRIRVIGFQCMLFISFGFSARPLLCSSSPAKSSYIRILF